MSSICSNCGPVQADHDDTLGHTVCTLCGQVIEENVIVADLSFSEKASGAAVADGFSISKDQSRAKSLGKFGSSAESRERVLENGIRRISQVANAMQLSNRFVDAAQKYFHLAVSNNFNKGRKTNNIAAACLYIICRIEKTSHMLIDFSDVLQTNVYVLGATFLKLIQILHFRLPLVDPSLYIARFAAKLEFENSTQKVIADSQRLIQRMSRDWIQIGRRPSGVCAAALFIAARMNGFTRSYSEIIHVVKIGESTLKKRLEEFTETPSGSLSVSEFQNVWLEQSANPPSFLKRPSDVLKEQETNQESALLVSLIKGNNSLDSFSTAKKKTKKSREADLISEDEYKSLECEMKEFLQDKVLKKYLVDEVAEDLSFLDDDDEVKGAILDDYEIEFRSMIWNDENQDWVDKQIEKIKGESGDKSKTTRRKKRKESGFSAANPVEAAMNVVQSKPAMSKKINYAILETILEE